MMPLTAAWTGDPKQIALQRARDAGKVCKACGLWSVLWAKRVVEWSAHVQRAHTPATAMIAQLTSWRNSAVIDVLRSNRNGKLDTRARTGKVAERFDASVKVAKLHALTAG